MPLCIVVPFLVSCYKFCKFLLFFLYLRLLHSLLKFSPMLDGVSQVVLEAYSRFYYSYPYSQQQQDEQELSIPSTGSKVHRL